MVQYRITKNRGTGKYRLEFKSGNDYLVCTDYELMKSEFVRDNLGECQLEMYKRMKEDNDSIWDVILTDEVDISGSLYKNPNDKQGYSSKYDSKGNLRPKTVKYPKGGVR